ncbi:MAG: DUF87 domain-containing protein [Thermoplasmata archaeon]|nr:DUF87 domain-containing protein [Thermoplasmata archaeon]MCI4359641.1 DUF87 domain-containing protein [Thermoplasmata archaeon]
MTRRRVEGESWVVGPLGFSLPVVIPELPKEVPFGFLGRILAGPSGYGLRMQFHRIPRPRSLDLLEGAGSVAEAELSEGRPSGSARTADLELEAESARELGRRVASGAEDLFRVGLALHAQGPSMTRAEQRRSELLRRLASLGFRTRVPRFEAGETLGPPDLLGTERRPPGYWHTLSTDGLGAFFPFVDEAVVEPHGVLVGLLLDDAAPVVLDRWRHASHSWGIFGMTGSGKSFAASLWALRSRWTQPDVELYLVDPLGEFARLAEATGGQVVRPAVPGGPRINPLDAGEAASDGPGPAARITAVLRALFPSLNDEEGAALDTAVARLYGATQLRPTLSDLLREVERLPVVPSRLSGLLEVFRTGSLRHLDGPTTVDWARTPLVFDLSGAAEGQLPFYLAFLLDAVYGRLKGSDRPKLVLVDEAHLLARVPATAEFLDRLVRHVRHFHAGLLIASQNPDDFLRTESGRSLLRNLRASFLLRLPEVSEAARRFFSLTESEAEWLPRARLPKEAGYSEGLLRFGPSHLPIAIVASTPEYELLSGTAGPGPKGH